MLHAEVAAKWHELCIRLGIHDSIIRHWNDIIVTHYGETWRFYHTLSHIGELLEHCEAHRPVLINYDVVLLAVFFHESVAFNSLYFHSIS